MHVKAVKATSTAVNGICGEVECEGIKRIPVTNAALIMEA